MLGRLGEVVEEFHRHGLFLFTWGDSNNNIDNYMAQARGWPALPAYCCVYCFLLCRYCVLAVCTAASCSVLLVLLCVLYRAR